MLATELSVPHADASQPVLDFWYYSCPSNQINIDLNIELTDLILEVKELEVIHQNSIRLTSLITFFHKAML